MGNRKMAIRVALTGMLLLAAHAGRAAAATDDRPYVDFPALVFSDRQVQADGDVTRVILRGRWHNVAPQAVRYDVTAHLLPRSDGDGPKFRIVGVEPAAQLRLERGGEADFSLTVEARGELPASYAEMVVVTLASRDVVCQPKPYLMCASLGYRPVDPDLALDHINPYRRNSHFVLRDAADVPHVVPTRKSLGFENGVAARGVHDAFLHALAEAPKPVIAGGGSRGDMDFTAWAREGGPNAWRSLASRGKEGREILFRSPAGKGDYQFRRSHPLAAILAATGQKGDLDVLKTVVLTLSDELPFYPLHGGDAKDSPSRGRWDDSNPMILPVEFGDRTGAFVMAAYIRLAQAGAMTDQEHFRFLHNVLLPCYLAWRDELRIHGTLAKDVRAGDVEVSLAGAALPSLATNSHWFRIGSDEKIDFVRYARRFRDGTFALASEKYPTAWGPFPGGFQRDHAAGEPWALWKMDEWIELEGKAIWSFVVAALASRDQAVMEQCLAIIGDIYSTQGIFREDGSFANEPGSYGWAMFPYMANVHNLHQAIGPDAISLQPDLKQRMLNALLMWNEFPFSNGRHPMLNGGGSTGGPLPRTSRALDLLRKLYPDQGEPIARFEKVIEQENARRPGSIVENRSFKIDGWGYAMLRGPGSWDRRMETLLSSKRLMYFPGDHVSQDCMGLVLYAHGQIMTPRYGYDWRGYPDFLLNRGRVDNEKFVKAEQRISSRIWGDFAHFDDHRQMPSAVAWTNMSGSHSHEPGPARQERWCVQLPEYLFDAYSFRTLDGREHLYQWGFHNLGTVAVTAPTNATLAPTTNSDGTPWDPFRYYRENTGHEGAAFTPEGMWSADWTLESPVGARVRLTMAGEPHTKVVTAWLTGPGGQAEATGSREDFVVAYRQDRETCFVSTYEPIAAGAEPVVRDVAVIAQANNGARVVRVTRTDGADYFLVGGLADGATDLGGGREVRQIGPFRTDAALAVVCVRGNVVERAMIAGGRELSFKADAAVATYRADERGTHHFRPAAAPPSR